MSSEELSNCRRLLGAVQLINANEAASDSHARLSGKVFIWSAHSLQVVGDGDHLIAQGLGCRLLNWQSEKRQNQDQALVPRAGCLLLLAHLPYLKQSAQKVTTIEQNTFLCVFTFSQLFHCHISTPPPHLFFHFFLCQKQ